MRIVPAQTRTHTRRAGGEARPTDWFVRWPGKLGRLPQAVPLLPERAVQRSAAALMTGSSSIAAQVLTGCYATNQVIFDEAETGAQGDRRTNFWAEARTSPSASGSRRSKT